jgi:hypothetical protein
MPTSEENLQILGGVLIVLSLALLYCWNKKTYDGFNVKAGPYMYGTWDNIAGMSASPILSARQVEANLPGLQFGNSSMHDMFSAKRNVTVPTSVKNTDVMNPRWMVDSHIATPVVDNNSVSHRAMDSVHDVITNMDGKAVVARKPTMTGGLVVAPELQTPNTSSVVHSHDPSTTSVQLRLGNNGAYTPQYATNFGMGAVLI